MKTFKSPKPLAGFSPLERMVSRLVAHIGESVVVEWEDDDDDWPTFRVLSVDIKRHRVWLKGEDNEEGHRHDGNGFWAAVADIKSVRRRAENAAISDSPEQAGCLPRSGSLPEQCPHCGSIAHDDEPLHWWACGSGGTPLRRTSACYERELVTMRKALLACEDHLPRLVHILRRAECYSSADATRPIIEQIRAALKAENASDQLPRP